MPLTVRHVARPGFSSTRRYESTDRHAGAVLSFAFMTAEFENLVDIFDYAIKSYGSRELFGTKRAGSWTWSTYDQFGKDVERARAGLAALGLSRGDHVAIISDNRVEWAVLAYGCFGLGAAFVPMYEAQHEKDWEFIVNDCDAKVLVVANKAILDKCKKLFDVVPSLQKIVCLEEVAGEGSKVTTYKSLLDSTNRVGAQKPKREDTACIIYTSGTTGNPKGVVLSHYNIASNVNAVHSIFPMNEADRSLSFLPWAHVFGQVCELHCLFSLGASMGLCESTNKIIENLAEVRPTVLMSVPRIFNKIYQAVQKQIAEQPAPIQSMVKSALAAAAKERDGTRLSIKEHVVLTLADKLVFSKVRARFGGRLRYAFSGGAAISRDVAEFIDSLGVTVYEGYGLSETSPIATTNCPGERRIGSVGRAIPGVRIVIDPKVTTSVRTDRVEGEILVYGPNVMQGYLKRPEENAAVFVGDGGFRTGDQGYLDPHGYLYITGRIKEQYKLENGKYVVPSPLEEKLKLSPYILNAFVFGDNKPCNVALLVANVEAVKKFAAEVGITATGDALLEHAKVKDLFKKELGKYGSEFKGFEEIREFALITEDFTTENEMLTPSLKVKRRKVLEKYETTLMGLYTKKKSPQASASAN